MEENFFATDPRGWQVECSEARFAFLLSKQEESIELITAELIQLAIREPDQFIYASNSKPNCHIYYKRYKKLPTEIKVVVDFSIPDKPGVIKTFYLCSRRSPGEIPIWPPINP